MTPPAAAPARHIRSASVEGLLRGFELAPGTPAWRAALEAAGVTDGRLPEQVTVEGFRALIEHVARVHLPGLPRAEAVREAGARIFRGYRQTLLGQVAFAALRAMGPERLLKAAPQIVGRNTDFGERTSRELGPRHWEVVMRGVPLPPEYYRGLTEEALRTVGVTSWQVSWTQTGPEDFRYDVRW